VPKKVSARQTDQGLVEKYSWWNRAMIGYVPVNNEMLSQDRIYVTFLDGKVKEWGDKFDPADMIDKSMQINERTSKALTEMYQNQKPLEINQNVEINGEKAK
jgi:hypothetical protein